MVSVDGDKSSVGIGLVDASATHLVRDGAKYTDLFLDYATPSFTVRNNSVRVTGGSTPSFRPANVYINNLQVNQYGPGVDSLERLASPDLDEASYELLSSVENQDPNKAALAVVSIAAVLKFSGVILLFLTVAVTYGNALTGGVLMHPILLGVVGISGMTFLGMGFVTK